MRAPVYFKIESSKIMVLILKMLYDNINEKMTTDLHEFFCAYQGHFLQFFLLFKE